MRESGPRLRFKVYIKSDFFFFGKSVLTQFFKVLWDACVIAFNKIICLPVFVFIGCISSIVAMDITSVKKGVEKYVG